MIIKAFAIIFGCLTFGTVVVMLTGIKFPASILGLLTLFVLLQLGWVKLESVKSVSDTLLDSLIILTIVPCVAIMEYLDLLADDGLAIVVSSVVSTLIVMAFTGGLHQWLRRR